jgi:hypothetical protein
MLAIRPVLTEIPVSSLARATVPGNVRFPTTGQIGDLLVWVCEWVSFRRSNTCDLMTVADARRQIASTRDRRR